MPDLIRLDDIEWEEAGACARQKRLLIGDRVARLLELRPGFEEPDWCFKHHVVHVVDGNLEIAFRDRSEKLVAGDSVVLSGGEGNEHHAVIGDKPVTLFLVDAAP